MIDMCKHLEATKKSAVKRGKRKCVRKCMWLEFGFLILTCERGHQEVRFFLSQVLGVVRVTTYNYQCATCVAIQLQIAGRQTQSSSWQMCTTIPCVGCFFLVVCQRFTTVSCPTLHARTLFKISSALVLQKNDAHVTLAL